MKMYPLIMVVGVLLMFFSFYYLYLWQHEQVHSEICRYAGGRPSINMFSGLFSASTICEIELEGEAYKTFEEQSGLTEIVGYHLLPFYVLLSIITVICIVGSARRWD